MGIACLTSTRATFGCELSRPLHVPLEGERQYYYETLGPLEFFKVRTIEGYLESRIFTIRTDGKLAVDQDIPLRKADLTLRNALTGEIVKSFATDEQGQFRLANVPSGSYVLHLVQSDEPNRSYRIEGDLLVELRADAKEVHLPLIALSMSDCGMDVHKKNDENSLNQKSESLNAQTN